MGASLELDRARSRSLLLEKLNSLPRLVHPPAERSVTTAGASRFRPSPLDQIREGHAARCVECHGVRSHPVPVALVGECSMPVV